VGFYGVGRNEQLVGDLLIGQPICQQLQYLILAITDSQRFDRLLIFLERWFGLAGQTVTEPDTQSSAQQCNNHDVDFATEAPNRVLVFEPLQGECTGRHYQGINRNRSFHEPSIGTVAVGFELFIGEDDGVLTHDGSGRGSRGIT